MKHKNFTSSFLESRIILNVNISSSRPVEEQYSSTPLVGINAPDNFETEFKTKEKTLKSMKNSARNIMYNFYKNTNPKASEDTINSYVAQFQAYIEASIPETEELLTAEKQKEYYDQYMETFKYFTDLQDESVRKNGVISVDGFMLGNNRFENFEIKKPFTALLKTPSDPVAYLKDKKNKTSVPFPENFSRDNYPNLTILEVEGVNPLIFKTGIVEIKKKIFHDEVIGLQIIDGDGHFHLYDARTKEFKIVAAETETQKNSTQVNTTPSAPLSRKIGRSSVTSLNSVDNIYTKFNSTHYDLFQKATTKITQYITELHAKNKNAKFDWGDWGDTPFEVNEKGDIVLDLDDNKNDTDVVIFTALQAQKINATTKLGNAQSLTDLLNKNKELLDDNILTKNSENYKNNSNQKIKKLKYTTDKINKNKPKIQSNTTDFLNNDKKDTLYKNSKIRETIDNTKKITTLQYKGITFTYLNKKNKYNKNRNNSKKFIEKNIQLLKNLGKIYTGVNNKKIKIEERLEEDSQLLLIVQYANTTYGTRLQNKNPLYKKINFEINKWENLNEKENKEIQKNINPFYTHLTGHTINKTREEKKADNTIEQQKKAAAVAPPAVAVEIK